MLVLSKLRYLIPSTNGVTRAVGQQDESRLVA
jgi:hypothetical protein